MPPAPLLLLKWGRQAVCAHALLPPTYLDICCRCFMLLCVPAIPHPHTCLFCLAYLSISVFLPTHHHYPCTFPISLPSLNSLFLLLPHCLCAFLPCTPLDRQDWLCGRTVVTGQFETGSAPLSSHFPLPPPHTLPSHADRTWDGQAGLATSLWPSLPSIFAHTTLPYLLRSLPHACPFPLYHITLVFMAAWR